MRKHLKYIDGNSDKFWQIEVDGSEYTVTYGRNGTSGTSQTKAFNDGDECLKIAEKLLNEKIKKGYSENGDVVISQKVTNSKNSTSTNINEILGIYDALVKSGKIADLLPFLKEHSKGNLEALKKQIRKNKRYWMDYVDLSNDPGAKPLQTNHSQWGVRGDVYQKEIIMLSALAIFNKTDINPWDEVFELLKRAEDPEIIAVLQWSSPSWIADFILEKSRRNEWLRFDYLALRFLESQGLLVWSPELYALTISNFNQWNSKIKIREYISYITNDKLAYERDVPELFSYETNLHNLCFRDDDQQAYNEFSVWEIIYDTLMQEGKLDRKQFISETILMQTKEWNNNLKSFFRKRLASLNLDAEELIPCQENIFACLHHSYAPVVNFAMEQVRKLYDNKKFNASSFLDWLEPVMMANDNKAAIKTALPILEKMNKLYPKLNKKISLLIANVYVVPDLNLQERATKVLQKIASAKDMDLQEKLASYTSLMQGNVPMNLGELLPKGSQTEYTKVIEEYHFIPAAKKVLLEEVVLPKDWNDIVYLFGSFINSDEVLDTELILNTYITQKHLFPADYSIQLDPYKKQLEKKYFESIHKAYTSVFLQQKIQDINYSFKVQDSTYHKIRTLLLIKPILHTAQEHINNNLNLSLLSFPTHKPYWIAPKVLMERLIARQQNNIKINYLDLNIAIGRMPREQTEEAIPLLNQLTGELKNLMSFCLGTTKEITLKADSLLGKLVSKVKGDADTDYKGIKCVAARTYYPQETFPQFQNTYLKDYPFVVAPLKHELEIKEQWHEYMNYQTKQKERSPTWYKLSLQVSGYQNVPDYCLYGLDIYGKKTTWEYNMGNEGNVYYWHSLMPQNADALSCFLINSSCTNADNGGKELKGFLNLLNNGGFPISDLTMLVFACAFFQSKKDIRLMASEVLINLIEQKAIDLKLLAEKLGYLASNKYGAFLRLADSIGTLKDVSALHNSAYLLLLEGIFEYFTDSEKLPVNFKKMVEHYIDVLYKTNKQPSATSIVFYNKWKDNATLKALIKQIIK
jgi:predicted DNA-binding WGR domain protein